MEKAKHRRAIQGGNVLIEFALTVTVLLPITAGVFQYGYGFYAYTKLEGRVRAAARYASRKTYDSSTTTPSDAFKTAVQNVVLYGDPGGGSQVTVPNLTVNNVVITVKFMNSAPNTIAVAITGFTIDGIFGTLTLTGKPFAVFRYTGRFAPSGM